MKQKLSIIALALVAMLGVQSAKAWGGFGHSAIAYVAEQHLTPKAKAECRRYLKHTLPYYASWMDASRTTVPYEIHDWWHNVAVDSKNNVVELDGRSGYVQCTRIIKEMKNYKNMTDAEVKLNLLYLIHLVADMHCPCHNVWPKESHPQYRYHLTNNKGGKESFHKFWDNTAITYGRKKWTATTYANKMATLSEKEIKKICKGDAYKWSVQNANNILKKPSPK